MSERYIRKGRDMREIRREMRYIRGRSDMRD